jgi:hypothetical protein
MSEERVLTPQEEESQAQWFRGRSASSQFMRRNPRYAQTEPNAKKLSDWIKANGKEWTVSNLEEAFQAIKSELELKPEYVKPAPPPPPKEDPVFEWGTLSKASINDIPREQYRKWIKNEEFQRQVNNVLNGRGQYE